MVFVRMLTEKSEKKIMNERFEIKNWGNPVKWKGGRIEIQKKLRKMEKFQNTNIVKREEMMENVALMEEKCVNQPDS